MGWSRGSLTQPFRIEVDIEKLADYITDQILSRIADNKEIDCVDFDEWYLEDSNLVINGSYDAEYVSCYVPATRYEPAEYDCERPWIGDEGAGLLDTLPEDMRKLVSINKVTEDEENCTYKDNAPDEDDIAYDLWKDK